MRRGGTEAGDVEGECGAGGGAAAVAWAHLAGEIFGWWAVGAGAMFGWGRGVTVDALLSSL